MGHRGKSCRRFNCQLSTSHLTSSSNLWLKQKLTVFLLQWALPFSNLRSVLIQIRAAWGWGGGCYHLLTYWVLEKSRLIKHALKALTNKLIKMPWNKHTDDQTARWLRIFTASITQTQFPFICDNKNIITQNDDYRLKDKCAYTFCNFA